MMLGKIIISLHIPNHRTEFHWADLASMLFLSLDFAGHGTDGLRGSVSSATSEGRKPGWPISVLH